MFVTPPLLPFSTPIYAHRAWRGKKSAFLATDGTTIYRTMSVSEAIEIELIRSLYDAFVPSIIMSLGFIVGGALISWRGGDLVLLVPFLGGSVAATFRLRIARLIALAALDPRLSIDRARQLERQFATAYYVFAAMLGLFGARVFWLPASDAHLLTLCLLLGYGSGAASGLGLRPGIAIPSLLMAILPPAIVAIGKNEILYAATAVMTIAFLASGIVGLRKRHARATAGISLRFTFASLARHDVLTALPNRLALREWFDCTMAVDFGSMPSLIAVHCLDLNGFKPVNDNYGHPTGDALLAAVGKRLAATIRENDMVARLGGDEFVVVQRGMTDPAVAERLAERIVASIAQPFQINGHEIRISTCVGYVVCDQQLADLERLINQGDEALYAAKRENRSINGRNFRR